VKQAASLSFNARQFTLPGVFSCDPRTGHHSFLYSV